MSTNKKDISSTDAVGGQPPHPAGDGDSPREYPMIFIGVIIAAMLAASAYGLRSNGIFACQAVDPSIPSYLAYCQANQFGDYDHGAFWFGLEDEILEFASRADVLFVGNSRMQFGLSSNAMSRPLQDSGVSYYLLGFSHMENYQFAGPIIDKIEPAASLVVVNVDLFFEDRLSPPARDVMTDAESLNRYRQKKRWQRVHEFLCASAPAVCGSEIAFYRSRQDGSWYRKGGDFEGRASDVVFDESIDARAVDQYTPSATSFLQRFRGTRTCIVLTNTPQSGTSLGTARALAERLDLPLIAPTPGGLKTFDGSHLDRNSAERWSGAVSDALAPFVDNCVGKNGT